MIDKIELDSIPNLDNIDIDIDKKFVKNRKICFTRKVSSMGKLRIITVPKGLYRILERGDEVVVILRKKNIINKNTDKNEETW